MEASRWQRGPTPEPSRASKASGGFRGPGGIGASIRSDGSGGIELMEVGDPIGGKGRVRRLVLDEAGDVVIEVSERRKMFLATRTLAAKAMSASDRGWAGKCNVLRWNMMSSFMAPQGPK